MLHLIVWVVVALLALSFFGISLRAIAGSPTNQDNVAFLVDTLKQGWHFIATWISSLVSGIMDFGSHL
jgi:hypothetical protein